MKIFEYCPFCKSLLQSRDNGNVSIIKKCLVCQKINITCKNINNKNLFPDGIPPDNEIYYVEVVISDTLIVGWWLESKEMYVYQHSPIDEIIGYTYLPFFEPDFSDYDKLCKKIKIFTLFS